MLLHLPDGTNPSRSVTPLPPRSRPCLPRAMRRCRADSLRLSLTWDQGPEMHEWEYVSVDADIEIYFCDPHSPWQLTLATRHQRKHQQPAPAVLPEGHRPERAQQRRPRLGRPGAQRPTASVYEADRTDRRPPVAITARIRRSAIGTGVPHRRSRVSSRT